MAAVPHNVVVSCEGGANDGIHILIVKRARVYADKLIDSKRPHPDLQDIVTSIDPRVLRHVYFLNVERPAMSPWASTQLTTTRSWLNSEVRGSSL